MWYTSGVKQWSKALDFLQTLLQDKCFLIYWACTKNSYFIVKSEAKNRNSCIYWACTKNSYFMVKSEAKKPRNSHKLNLSINEGSHDVQIWKWFRFAPSFDKSENMWQKICQFVSHNFFVYCDFSSGCKKLWYSQPEEFEAWYKNQSVEKLSYCL